MRLRTLSAAASLRVKTVLASWTLNISGLLQALARLRGYPTPDHDVARLGVVQRRELLDASPVADGVDHALAEPAVQVAHQLRVGLGELAERAVEELDAGAALVGAVGGLDRGLEPEPGQLALERAEAAPRPGAPAGVGAPHPAGLGGVDARRRRPARPARRAGRRAARAPAGRSRATGAPAARK